jgi:hypothetical protein
MEISTAVIRCRETRSVKDKKICPPSVITADKLEDVRDAPFNNLHERVF